MRLALVFVALAWATGCKNDYGSFRIPKSKALPVVEDAGSDARVDGG